MEGALGYSEVNNLDSLGLAIVEHILRLDVAMADVSLMDVTYSFKQLRKKKLQLLHKIISTS